MPNKRPLKYDPAKPYFADGIRFDEFSMFTEEQQRILVGRELVWLTSFDDGGMPMAGSVIAANKEHAIEIVDARGLGETVGYFLEIPNADQPPMWPL